MERQSLLSSSQKYKQALEQQVSHLRENAINVAIQGLIFGGLALGTWFLVKSITGKNPDEEKSSHVPSAPASFASGIAASIQGAIASFLLSIAREKIMEVIENYLDKQNASSGKAA